VSAAESANGAGANGATPTSPVRLSSRHVASFVANGYLRLDQVVPPELCAAALAALGRGAGPESWSTTPAAAGEPSPDGPTPRVIEPPVRPRLEEAFPATKPLGQVLALPAIKGAIESLLGPHPFFDHHHAHVIPAGHPWAQGWHADAVWDPRTTAFDVQLMFFFHDTPRAMGGTMFLPGSHLRRVNEADIARYQNFRGQMAMACSAGSVLLLHHGIWHCGQPNRSSAPRTMWKVRLGPRVPQRLTWDTADLRDPGIAAILSTDHGWYGHEARLEIVQRIRLWRAMTAQPTYDIDQWVTRFENVPG
jgi:hypothetical protein